MKTGVAALIGGIVGGLGVLCFLVAFGTDYWLLASDDCGDGGGNGDHGSPGTAPPQTNTSDANVTLPSIAKQVDAVTVAPSVTLHHEGFFWRCEFQGDPSKHVILAVLFTNQPASKVCIHGYLFPLPVAVGPVPHPMYDATAVFRGFWTVFIILALVAGLVGGFLLVCAVPFTSHKLYRVGGIFLIIAASLFLVLVLLFVLWKELVDIRSYVLQDRGHMCPDVQPEAHYGWSFMVAAAGIPLALLSGLLFYFTGRHLQQDK